MPNELTEAQSGNFIACDRCEGSGIGQKASSYIPWDEECSDCGGSGKNWLYPRGAIAKHYGGPLIGRITPAGRRALESSHDS